MPGYVNDEERATWLVGEAMLRTACSMMKQAEEAQEAFKHGQDLTKDWCARRGIGSTDAEIRWSGTAQAQNALAQNSFHVGLATMYFGAAAAHFVRAQYLRNRNSR
ncbi:hypothetical protein [Mangrovihabitans endophyticus]|uniref:Uncharacterized protein n=1 Tax=Mangrovihabitans endophyticus TaxID=1751298 RepID=A0A8J3C467_9ACTN|nr:hypothetical protein [Mangrovihabitans endophyticus]GGL07139.1 hypothetical protein GCM10012284_46690 [Mangrovihabitans endophyticus]